MHNATAITTGSANQRPNTPCIRPWIDVTFRGLEDSYTITAYQNRGMRVPSEAPVSLLLSAWG